MRGHVRRRGARWQTVIEIGEEPAQACAACKKVYWPDNKRRERCPLCGGELEDVRRRRQSTRSGFRTKKEAQAALTKELSARQEGTYQEPSDITVAEFLVRRWLPDVKDSLKPSTYLSYSFHVTGYLVPRLGALRLRVLDPGHVNKMYRELGQARGGRRGESLAPATRRHIHTTLRRALRDAVRWGLVSRNAAALADPPRVDRHNRTMNVWTREQIRTFLNHVADDRLFAMWRVFATTGMRRGEVCGLQWKHIDFERSLLTVRQARVNVGYKVQLGTTKTGASRVIPVGLNTVAALKAWRDRQADEFLELEIAQSPDHYLFTDKAGEPLHPDRVTKLFDQAVKAAGLPRIRLHDLRHSYATIGLLNGIHPKVMAERLGHADVMITLQTYSHVLKGMQESAAELLEASIDSE